MNLYFIVEGRRTESIVYPKWMSILLPDFQRIFDPFEVPEDGSHYYLFDGGGYPNILKDMIHAAEDINEIGKYDYFIVCLDCDDDTTEMRREQVFERFRERNITINSELIVITQRVCIESWFLGNRKLDKISGEIRKYFDFYNVHLDDPELMKKPWYFQESTSQFHFRYMEELAFKNGLRYSKSRPDVVCSKDYLFQLIERAEDTGHLRSFYRFIKFCKHIKKSGKKL
ncbi:MAG: hypothetical protein LBI03_01240 [Clostridiales bacterium]|jgi:hypothetical protein|nr:hypothetical protein [Clostridiales bacterium]